MASFSLALSALPIPSFPPTPPSPSLSPRIHPSLSSRGEEEAGASPPPPPRKRRLRSAWRSSPSRRRRRRSPRFPCSLSPSSPTPPTTPSSPVAAGAATATAASPGLEHAAPLRPPAATVATLDARRKIHTAAEAGSSSRQEPHGVRHCALPGRRIYVVCALRALAALSNRGFFFL